MRPHASQRQRAAVISGTNSSPSTPASALPSTLSIVNLPSSGVSCAGRSEAFGLHERRIEAELHKALRDRLDEPRRTADVRARVRLGHAPEESGVDPSREAVPARRL